MDLKTLANSIGVTEEYPEGMDKIYQNLSETKQPACDVNVVKQLEMTYHMFGAFYEDILKAADIINGDFLRSTWVRVASAYAEGVSVADACSIPTPAINGTLANDYLAFLCCCHSWSGVLRSMSAAVSLRKNWLNCFLILEKVLALWCNAPVTLASIRTTITG